MKNLTCKHKLAAVALASGAALAITGGTAFAEGGEHHGGDVQSKNASLGIGAAEIDQHSGVTNLSVGASNSGLNAAGNRVDQGNRTGQGCDANTSGGGTLALGLGIGSHHSRDDENASNSNGSADASGGNTGGSCTNDATSSNSANPEATILTGAATASNDTSTTVSQTNSGGVSVKSDNTGSVDPSGDARHVHQSGASIGLGLLSVDQSSTVRNGSIALANSGGNVAGNSVDQGNSTHQDGSANTTGGFTGAIGVGLGGSGDAKASGGNSGGSASNTASSSNTANPKASITTGAASASNSTTTNVTQNNSGGVSVSSSNSGSVG